MTHRFLDWRALFPALALASLACSDADRPISGINAPPTKANSVMAIDTTEDTWNYYSADVAVTREPGTNTAQISHGTTQSTFGVVRTLSGDMWSSDITEGAWQSSGLGTSPDPEVDIGRLQTDDAGSYLNAYTRTGSPVSITPSLMTDQYPILDPPPGHAPLPRFPTPPPGASSALVVGGGANQSLAKDLSTGQPLNRNGHRVEPRAWLANVVSTPKNRIRLAAGRLRTFGPPLGKVRELDRYVHTTNGTQIEELVDPITSATLERNIVANGRLLVHQTRSFVDVGASRFALVKIRIENLQSGSSNPTVTEITFDNVRIETRAR
jgi:hypothetical protein